MKDTKVYYTVEFLTVSGDWRIISLKYKYLKDAKKALKYYKNLEDCTTYKIFKTTIIKENYM